MLNSLFLNLGICFIKKSNFQDAILCCDEALKIRPSNLKALYRKAKALTSQSINNESIKKAIDCLKTALKYSPNEKIILKELSVLKNLKKQKFGQTKKKSKKENIDTTVY